MPYNLEPMKEPDICQCCSCEGTFPYALFREGRCPECGSEDWVWGYIERRGLAEIDQYICAALCSPLRDEQQLVEMVVLHFPDINEVMAQARVTYLLNRIRELSKRIK